jgi:predicted Zn-dependent peptidase
MDDLNIQPEPLDNADRQAIANMQGTPTSPAPASASQPDYIEELQRLASLRDSGIITNEEFEAKKQQLLGL